MPRPVFCACEAPKLYPIKWTRENDPRPRLVDTHLTHRVKWTPLWGTRKKFTPEELKHLRANPYTLRVTADSISYTLAFKEAFWALSLQGYTGTAAFRKLGYNTEVLGFERIHNTTKRIRRAAKSPEGLHEGTRGGVRLTGGTGPAAPADEAARRMKREILVLQQQMAFLKKVMKLHDGPEK